MKKIIDILDKIEEVFLVTLFTAMVLIIFIQVIMRKAGNSLYWSEELGKFLFLWISWIGISIGEKRGEHIKITMLIDKFPPKIGHIFNILSNLIVIVICGITVFYGIKLMGTQAGTHYTGIKISLAWGYLCVVLGCSLMILRLIGSTVNSIKGIKNGTPLASAMASEGGDEQ